MNIFKMISECIKIKTTKALPETTHYKCPNQRSVFVKKMNQLLGKTVKTRVNNRYLEKSLQLFFDSYQEILNGNVDWEPNSYNALIRINALEDDSDKNAVHEEELIEYILRSGKYMIQTQNSQELRIPIFYHIQTRGYISTSDDKSMRLYLNCRNENTAELAKALLKCNKDPQFYLKVNADKAIRVHSRSEKIVIYTTDSQFYNCIQLILYVKERRPELFRDFEEANPFMESLGGISYSKEPISEIFYRLNGLAEPIDKSYNTYIARIIKESYMETVKEIATLDYNLAFLLDSENYNNELVYMQNYPYINSKYHVLLINSMEQKMIYLCTKNRIVIKGINDTRQVESEQGVAPEQ